MPDGCLSGSTTPTMFVQAPLLNILSVLTKHDMAQRLLCRARLAARGKTHPSPGTARGHHISSGAHATHNFFENREEVSDEAPWGYDPVGIPERDADRSG